LSLLLQLFFSTLFPLSICSSHSCYFSSQCSDHYFSR